VTVQEYFLPESLEEALALVDEHGPSLLVMAGGTLAMPLINEGVSMPEMVMGLRRAGLDTFEATNGSVHIGATTTLTQMLAQDAVPLLATAAGHVGGWSIRNMGTVGGNLFAPPPSGDFAVALLALDAEVQLASTGGERSLPLEDFYTGFMMTALEPGEIVTSVSAVKPAGKTAYVKYGRKADNTPAIVTVAAHLTFDGDTVSDARVALNGVGPYPMRAKNAEAALIGAALDAETIAGAAAAAAEECEPFTDPIASEWYRRKATGIYVRRALEQMAG
jgi:CO/xanthine dehydrogenase FAD-binding subunit